MAQKIIDMNQIRQVQQLRIDGIPIKEIARRTGISRKTVKKYLRRLEQLDVSDDTAMSNKELAEVVYNNDDAPTGSKRLALYRHFEYATDELPKTGVTRQHLWLEYLEQYPGGYQYSQYCDLFRKYLKDSDPVFHMEYNAGEFIQVDFAGKTLCYVNRDNAKVISCEVLVGILPFSGLIYCQALASQKTADFIHGINELVKYVGGLSKTILCDNLRTAVKKADKYEPLFTTMCSQLSAHYNTTFSATRVASPTDKAMVEGAVGIVYTNIYAPLRKVVAGSLEELNLHIRQWLDRLNQKPYKGNGESRHDIFMSEEMPLLKTLPSSPFILKKCREVTVQRNYAIQLPDNKHYYTVPYRYVGKKVVVHYNNQTIEVFYQHDLIAFHVRSSTEPKFNRIKEHMPENHRYMLELKGWTVEELLKRANRVGAYTRQAADRILHSSIYPEQNYKACNAMLLLQNQYSKERLEAACLRASNVVRPTLKMIRGILKTGMDKQPLLFEDTQGPIPKHDNLRGATQYQ